MAQRKLDLQNEDVPLERVVGTRSSVEPELKVYFREPFGYLFFKRVMDVVLAGMALVVLFPFLLAVAVAIYIDDPHGGPIFVQDRVGKNGRVFILFNYSLGGMPYETAFSCG